MAIALMYEESLALRDIHQAGVVMCTVPGDPPLLKYSWFENSRYMLDLAAVLKRCGPLDYLLIHIPDFKVNQVAEWLTSVSRTLLGKIGALHLNVMVFNIDMIKEQDIAALARFGKVTCTTAHAAYSNAATRDAIGVPLHRLVICTGAEFYSPVKYGDKEPLLVVSPDAHPARELVLQEIAQKQPELRIQVIEGLTYEAYKKLIQRAKWSLTFGEGLDGYFAEPVFSGAISFAVFNARFFTPGFAELETVYSSWDVLRQKIAADISRLDEPVAYTQCWQRAYELLSEQLDTNRFREQLRTFYRGEYTCP
jgi:hypothetical protein